MEQIQAVGTIAYQ